MKKGVSSIGIFASFFFQISCKTTNRPQSTEHVRHELRSTAWQIIPGYFLQLLKIKKGKMTNSAGINSGNRDMRIYAGLLQPCLHYSMQQDAITRHRRISKLSQ